MTQESYSDEMLIYAIAGGAVWAMGSLYDRYARILYALAYRMVADHQVAEDLLQESFLSVWLHAKTYSPKQGTVRSWLTTITHHRTIDYLRSLRRRSVLKQTNLDEVERDERAAFPDVWEEVWSSVQSEQVRGALQKLPAEQRLVIELAYFQGWTHSEIAEGCQIPLGTVKARMRLGLLRLRRELGQSGLRDL